MKKILSLSLVTAVMAAGLFASPTVLTEKQIQENIDLFPKLFKGQDISVDRAVREDNFDHLEFSAKTPKGMVRFEAFVIKGKEPSIIVGKAFKQSGQPYELPKSTGVIENGVAFSLGHGQEEFYLVTDPECPYCQDYEDDIAKKLDLDKYTIHVIPIALNFHKQAKPMLQWVLSAPTKKDRATRMNTVMSGDSKWKDFIPMKEQREKNDKVLEAAENAAYALGATGTPALFDSNFKKVQNRNKIFE